MVFTQAFKRNARTNVKMLCVICHLKSISFLEKQKATNVTPF